MHLTQIIIIVFALFALSRVFLQLKHKTISKGEFLFWAPIWILAIIFSVAPNLSTMISNIFGIGRGVDIFIYFGIIILFYLVFRLYVKLENQREEITRLTREYAIREAKKKGKRRQS